MLAFDRNPPLSAPLRYFLSAPLFAALAAVLLLWQGGDALASRWSPATLALTHLLTLGCLTMTMVGALLQILPVVAGVALPRAALTTGVAHVGLCAGSLLLAAGFWLQRPALFQLAMATLLPALLMLLSACALGLWRHAGELKQQARGGASATVTGIRLALAALAVTVTLGGLLAAAFAWPAGFTRAVAGVARTAATWSAALFPGQAHAPPLLALFSVLDLLDLHVAWGLLGWVGVLVAGVAFQVIPMFQVTEPYPHQLTRWFGTLAFALLAALSLMYSLGDGLPRLAVALLLAAVFALFALTTVWLLARRERPRAEPTTIFWRCAMASLLAALLVWLLPHAPTARPLALGVLMIVGFGLSSINGMLYKIVPFLVWYHLQATPARAAGQVPGVNRVIPERHARWQLGLHLLALALLLAACYQPALLARPAAAALCASCLALWWNLFAAVRLFGRLNAVAPKAAARACA